MKDHSQRKRFESQHQTINVLDKKEIFKRSTFTWHVDEPRNGPGVKFYQDSMNETIQRRKNIDLAPLPVEQKKSMQRAESLNARQK